MEKLVKKFHEDMINIYNSEKLLNYNASYFLQMVSEHGGYQAAKLLIQTDKPSDGFTRLWEMGRLDLSVEAHVLKADYKSLFTDDERQICVDRLEQYRCKL